MKELNPLFGKIAVVGVGYSKISRNSGVSVLNLATEACLNAIQDAGLTPKDVDGLTEFALNDSVDTMTVASALGIPQMNWFNDILRGGDAAVSVVLDAAIAINSGLCHTVVAYRALNGRSMHRIGQFGAESTAGVYDAMGPAQFNIPMGYGTPPLHWAMIAQRHMHLYGTTEEHLGQVAISCRKHASLNERAPMRTSFNMEEYLNSRWIAEPLRILDCCLEVDGACALVLTSRERAKSMKQKPVYIMGGVYGCGPRQEWDYWPDEDYVSAWAKHLAPILWERTGVTHRDLDFAEIYDCFSINTIIQLEDLGFCEKGEGGAYVEGGSRIELGGECPVNTNGGLLSEGYVHGLNHSTEAVLQLRGQAGAAQVEDAKIGLATSGGIGFGGGIVYYVE